MLVVGGIIIIIQSEQSPLQQKRPDNCREFEMQGFVLSLVAAAAAAGVCHNACLKLHDFSGSVEQNEMEKSLAMTHSYKAISFEKV